MKKLKFLATILVFSLSAIAGANAFPVEGSISSVNLAAPISDRRSLSVSDGVWSTLTFSQKNLVSAHYAIEVSEKGRYARIVYVQPVNESTAGTTAGAQLGSALGQAQYIDKSNWSNYSARGQLGAAILGGLIGSTLDARSQSAYRLVYTLKASDGSIRVVERVSESQIYIAPGLCIDTTGFSPVKDEFCENTWPQEIRTILGAAGSENQIPVQLPTVKPIAAQAVGTSQQSLTVPISKDDLIYCRFGPTSTAQTSAMKCLKAGGTIQ